MIVSSFVEKQYDTQTEGKNYYLITLLQKYDQKMLIVLLFVILFLGL